MVVDFSTTTVIIMCRRTYVSEVSVSTVTSHEEQNDPCYENFDDRTEF